MCEHTHTHTHTQIMHHLAGHPNVVNLKGVYEDKSNVCLAMEVRAHTLLRSYILSMRCISVWCWTM